jgi:hypothetical protein
MEKHDKRGKWNEIFYLVCNNRKKTVKRMENFLNPDFFVSEHSENYITLTMPCLLSLFFSTSKLNLISFQKLLTNCLLQKEAKKY